MSRHSYGNRHEGNWDNVQEDCILCRMPKKTEWMLETPRLVIAEKLGGGPFVVWKEHKKELTEDEWDVVEHAVGLLYDDFELDVRMQICKQHWHAHLLVEDEDIELVNE